MGSKWGNLAKFLVPLGTGVLAAHGIPLPLDQIINRPKRSRRRRRGSIDYVALATGIREVLKAKLSEDELEEFDMVIAEFFRLVVGERQEEAPPPRRKRTTKRSPRQPTKKTAKRR